MMDGCIAISSMTRPCRDGGRDAIGIYRFGPKRDPIAIDFALEAKCKGMESGVGVRLVGAADFAFAPPAVRRSGYHILLGRARVQRIAGRRTSCNRDFGPGTLPRS
jgi:hypothetical protein